MTDKLPPNLLALFAPRPPLRWVQPTDHAPELRRTAAVPGVAQFLPALAAYATEYEYHPTESWLEKRDRLRMEKKAALEELVTGGPKSFNPSADPNIRGDAFKTLIVTRLSYKANEADLEKEFGRCGPIERIRLIVDTHADEKKKKKKPHRGYGFVVFEREKDMRAALESCDGMKIQDRRIKLDVERGRTVKGWKPRRLGGGLGGRGYTKAMPNRAPAPGFGFQPFNRGFGGGGGGGGGGGFRGRDRGFRGGGGFNDRGGFGDRGGFSDRGFRGGGGGFRGGDRNFGGSNGFPSNAPNGPGGGGGGGWGGRGEDRGGRRDFNNGGHSGRDGGRDGGREGWGGRPPFDDSRSGGGGGGPRDSRGSWQPGGGGASGNSNFEPIRPRDRDGRGDRFERDRGDRGGRDSDRPRDHDRPRDSHDDSRKRPYEGGGYEESRKLRRY